MTSHAACLVLGIGNLSVPSFQQVTDIDFDDDRPVTRVRTTIAPEDGWDW